jgi:hypothetical protein
MGCARKPGLVSVSEQNPANGDSSEGVLNAEPVIYRYTMSGKPRWMEGSRYYLQFAGMPDSITYSLNNDRNDYNDDYMSRPEWVNYLIGPSYPIQQNIKMDWEFLDLALAFLTGVDTAVIPVLVRLVYSAVKIAVIFMMEGQD